MQLQTIPTGTFTPGNIPHDRQVVGQFLLLLESKFKERHDPDFYSSALNLSLKRLNRLLMHYHQKTAYQLLQDRLHQEAELLLIHTTLSAKEIAVELGVCDPAHFSKCFKKVTGLSPLAYRKTILQLMVLPSRRKRGAVARGLPAWVLG